MPFTTYEYARDLTLGVVVSFALVGCAASGTSDIALQGGSANIDADGFLDIAEEVIDLRQQRLVSLAEFQRMADADDTIILDTRSADAFAMGHMRGAINLPFSDFTDDKLAEIIPSKDTRILIYCNNNFVDDVAPILLKRAELALNVPTFINLVGYGYENVYELGALTRSDDPDVYWVSEPLGS